MKIHRAHKIRLNPNNKQVAYFARACGVSRFTWNWALAEWKRQYEAGNKPFGSDLRKQFNAIKGVDYPWVYDVLRDANSQPFENVQTAFNRFFKGKSRHPKFKKKGIHDSFYMANDVFCTEGRKIYIPKLGWIRLQEALRFEGKIMSATVSRRAHRWYVSISVEIDKDVPSESQAGAIGVDLGVKALATLSDGTVIVGTKPHKALLARMRLLNKALARKQKGSRRRQKAKDQLARLHARIADIRNDALHKLTSYLVRNYGIIGIEDLNVSGMVRNRHLSRAIMDMGFGEFRRQLEYKAEAEACKVVVADRWFPSSKMCSDCGFILDILPLSVREWTCPNCGVIHDRDDNASINLEKMAVGSTVTARGEGSAGFGFGQNETTLNEARISHLSA